MDNFNDIALDASGATFSGVQKAVWNTLWTSLGLIFNNIFGIAPQIPETNFYSQVPYALGEKYAMKMEFRHSTIVDGCFDMEAYDTPDDTWELNRANFVSKALQLCDLKFDLVLKVLEREGNEELINRQATRTWNHATEYNVGTLTIPMQNLDVITGQSAELQTYLDDKVNIGENLVNAHKLFRFHPIATIEEHQPVGEVNMFRSNFYSQHAKLRSETLQQGLGEALKFPFEQDFNTLIEGLSGRESALAKTEERRNQKKYTETDLGHSTLATPNTAEVALYGFAMIGAIFIVRRVCRSLSGDKEYQSISEPKV